MRSGKSMGVRANSTGRRVFALVIATVAALGLAVAPPATADVIPIGNLGQTLRVEYKGVIADVTVHDVLPTTPPPGYTPTGSPRWRDQGGPWRAGVTVHIVESPNPF